MLQHYSWFCIAMCYSVVVALLYQLVLFWSTVSTLPARISAAQSVSDSPVWTLNSFKLFLVIFAILYCIIFALLYLWHLHFLKHHSVLGFKSQLRCIKDAINWRFWKGVAVYEVWMDTMLSWKLLFKCTAQSKLILFVVALSFDLSLFGIAMWKYTRSYDQKFSYL